MAGDTLLQVSDLGITFGGEGGSTSGEVRAIDGIDFEVSRGQILGLVGESGSGKTVASRSLVRLLPRSARLDPASRILLETADGPVDVAGLDPRDGRLRRIRGGEIAMIFQEPRASFAPTQRVAAPIVEAARLHRDVTKSQAQRIAIDLLERVGISEPARRARQYPFELSGGMRQRAMIAVALASRPSLLIADEPTTALDVTIQAQILELLRDLRDEFGMAILFITHDLGVISQLADDVAVMYLGQIMEQAPVERLIAAPEHPYTQRLLRAIPRLDRRHEPLSAIPGDLPTSGRRMAGCPFHSRCEVRIEDRCTRERPSPLGRPDGGVVACHLVGAEQAVGPR